MITRRFLFIAVTTLALGSSVFAQAPAERSATIQQKLDGIIFPIVQFQKATIDEALEYLRVKSRDLDTSSASSGEKGVALILKKESSSAPITIDLRDVTLGIALKYCAELAGLKHRVEPYGVFVAADFKEPYTAPPVLAMRTRSFSPRCSLAVPRSKRPASFFASNRAILIR